MLIKEIWPEDDIKLNEIDLKKTLRRTAAAGALGAGMLGIPDKSPELTYSPPLTIDEPIYVPHIEPNFVPPPAISDKPIKIPPPEKQIKNPPDVHPSFPHQLVNQPKISGQHRVSNFIIIFYHILIV